MRRLTDFILARPLLAVVMWLILTGTGTGTVGTAAQPPLSHRLPRRDRPCPLRAHQEQQIRVSRSQSRSMHPNATSSTLREF